MAEKQTFMACKYDLYAQLQPMFGEEVGVEALKNILCFSSTDAVVGAISKGRLKLPVIGQGSPRKIKVMTMDVAAYIADQYGKSLNKN